MIVHTLLVNHFYLKTQLRSFNNNSFVKEVCLQQLFDFAGSIILDTVETALFILSIEQETRSWLALLQWRLNERDGVSSHQPQHWLLNRSFRRRSKEHQRSASLVFVRGIHRWPVNSPHRGPVTRKIFHHVVQRLLAYIQYKVKLGPLNK